ncbi:mitochondrial import inner membrane translocase subunit TIM50-like [Babylonia areolata]|uniref:mitochondrial import inner membrane translocase subunit TIM50-like n=1 Tax=Babylonia areolata TaxID=304850 RepID=UPI003FD34A73
MAAYSVCMCVVRRCSHLRYSNFIVRALVSDESCQNRLLSCKGNTLFLRSGILYSTQTTTGESKGLADDILKEKLAASRLADDKTQSSGDDSSNKQDSDKGSEKKKSGRWTGPNAWKLGLVFLGGWSMVCGGVLVYSWGSPPLDPEGKEIEDEFSELPRMTAMFKRAFKEMNLFTKKIQEPSRERLLPDPLKYPYLQPPYTLVLEMTGVLVHPDWTYSTGWRFKKRPGIEYFLSQVGPPLFEVVIYSQEQGMTADPLVSSLDPQGYVMYRLYRDATRYMNGHHIKDLGCLNRDLSKVIMLDWNPSATQLQPENTLLLSKWSGDDEDRTLVDLAHFLKTIAASEVEDVRKVLEYYAQFDDPIAAFKENQRKLQEEQERMAEDRKQKEDKKLSKWGLSSFIRRR